MIGRYTFDVAFSPPRTAGLPGPGDAGAGGPWTDDPDPATHERLEGRNRAWSQALRTLWPELLEVQADPEDLLETMDPGQPVELVLRRGHRYTVLEGHCDAGLLSIRMLDHRLDVGVGVDSVGPGLHDALEQLFGRIAGITGWQVEDGSGRWDAPADAAQALLQRHAAPLRRFTRAQRRQRLQVALGPASAALLTLLALAAVLGLLSAALDEGGLVVRTDPARAATFVTTALPPPLRRTLQLPGLALEGRIEETGQVLRLGVFRDVYLRAAPGARYGVLATSDPAQPWVLRSRHERAPATLPLPGGGGIAWFGLVALVPAGLWWWTVARPWRRARSATRDSVRVLVRRDMTRRLLFMAQLGAFAAGVLWLRGLI